MADDRVNLVSPEGELYDTSQDQVQDALDKGFQIDTPEMQAQREQQAKYGSAGQQIQNVADQALTTLGGPAWPFAQQAFLGEKPEDIRGREAANPVGTFAGRALGIGMGVAGGVGLPGAAAEIAADLGVGAVGRGAVEMGLLQLGDESAKYVLADPNQTASSAIANVGLSAALGGAMGLGSAAVSSAFGKAGEVLGNTKLGDGAREFIERLKYRADNPDLAARVTEDFGKYYQGMEDFTDKVYGEGGIKAADLGRAMPSEMTPKLYTHIGDSIGKINDVIDKVQAEPNIFSGRAGKLLEGYRDRLISDISEQSTPGQVFDALQDFKQNLGGLSKWGRQSGESVPEMEGLTKKLYGDIRESLENNAWGEAGQVQRTINEAGSEYFNTLKDARQAFTSPLASGERMVDPGKLNTYTNQIGKAAGAVKQTKLQSFIDASEKFKDAVGKSYYNLGISMPETMSPDFLKSTTAPLSPYAKAADALVNKGLAKLGGAGLGTAVGGAAGSLIGHPGIGAIVGEHALGPFFEGILPSIAKPLLQKASNSAGLEAALTFSENAMKTDSLLTKGAKALMEGEGLGLSDKHISSSPEELDKLDSRALQGQQAPQELLNTGSSLSHYMPEHAAALAVTTSRSLAYLNQVRPKAPPALPFDRPYTPSRTEEAQWKRTLQLADKPLSFLQTLKEGRTTPRDVQDMNAMHPALLKSLQNKISTELMNHQSKGGLPPKYSTRLHLSMALGQPLDSSMTAPTIQAVQAVFAAASPAPAMAQGGIKRGTKALQKAPGMYATADQFREQQKQTKA